MNQNGLTLLEVMVAMGIMAGLLAVAAPYMQRPPAITLEQAARQVAVAMRSARGAAIRANRPVAFTVDTASGRFGYDRLREFSGANPPIRMVLFTTTDQSGQAGQGTIRFFPDGGSTGGGVELLQRGRKVRVLVDWLSGGVTSEIRPPG